MSFLRYSLAILLFTTVACGDEGGKKSKKESTPKTPAAAFEQSIMGTWMSGCESISSGTSKSGVNITAGQVKTLWELYSGTRCDKRMGMIAVYASTSVGAKNSALADAYDVTLTPGKVTLTVFDSQLAQKLTTSKACGKDSWKAGEEQPIELDAPNCFGSASSPAKINLPPKVIVQKTGSQLKFFDLSSTATPVATLSK